MRAAPVVLVVLLLFVPLLAVPAGSTGAPTFRLLGAIARGGPGYGAGEPSVEVGPSGNILVAFPGCDQGVGTLVLIGSSGCANGPVYESKDDGASWVRQNGAGGLLGSPGRAANNDAEVAVDDAGNAYATNLGTGLPMYRRVAGETTWRYVSNPVQSNVWSDRQWMAAEGNGHVIVGWMGGVGSARQAALRATFDGGVTWAPVQFLGNNIGWIGAIDFAPDGTAYVVFTQGTGANNVVGMPRTFMLLVGKSTDGGRSWSVIDTGLRTKNAETAYQWPGVMMAPSLAVADTGRVVLAWSEEIRDPANMTKMAGQVNVAWSTDGGASWSAKLPVSSRASTIMPWIAAGASDRVVVSYFASDVPLDPDRVGYWDVQASFLDLAAATPTPTEVVVDRGVHEGGICSTGSGCFTLSPGDRSLLDFFQVNAMPDGRAVIAYPADPLVGGKYIDIRVAIQDGGPTL